MSPSVQVAVQLPSTSATTTGTTTVTSSVTSTATITPTTSTTKTTTSTETTTTTTIRSKLLLQTASTTLTTELQSKFKVTNVTNVTLASGVNDGSNSKNDSDTTSEIWGILVAVFMVLLLAAIVVVAALRYRKEPSEKGGVSPKRPFRPFRFPLAVIVFFGQRTVHLGKTKYWGTLLYHKRNGSAGGE